MSVQINSREVLKYLNELGYYNITAKQLKEFIKDLKILIKYEQKAAVRDENEENIKPPDECSCKKCNEVQKRNDDYEIDIDEVARQLNINNKCYTVDSKRDNKDLYNVLHSTSTVSSRAKSAPRKSVVSVNIVKKPVVKSSTSEIPEIRPASELSIRTNLTNKNNEDDNVRKSSSDLLNNLKPVVKEFRCKSADQFKKSKSAEYTRNNDLKPKVSFIRPRRPVKTSKSDPVLLYQQYQAEWKRQKLPGEDKHYDLRWAIRERMLGEPDIRPHSSVEKFARKPNRI